MEFIGLGQQSFTFHSAFAQLIIDIQTAIHYNKKYL